MRVEDLSDDEREFLRFLIERFPPPDYHSEYWPSVCDEARASGISLTDEQMERAFSLFWAFNGV